MDRKTKMTLFSWLAMQIFLKNNKKIKLYNEREMHERASKITTQTLLILQLAKTQHTPQPRKIKWITKLARCQLTKTSWNLKF